MIKYLITKCKFHLFVVLIGGVIFTITSCGNNVSSVHPNLNNLTLPTDTAGQLKDAASFPIGLGVDADLLENNQTYSNIVQQQFDIITPQHVMKQTVIVQDNGSFNYSKPDKLVQTAKSMGLAVHGHTLVWYQGNNGKYLRSLLVGGGGGSKPGPNVLQNGGFESWSNGVPSGWTVLNDKNGSFAKGAKSNNVHKGNNSLKVTTNSSAKAYNLQILSPKFNTKKGDTYQVTFWVKTTGSGSKYQIEARSGGSAKYSGTKNTPTSYTLVTFSFKAKSSSSSIAFDMGASPASISWIDGVEVRDVSSDAGGGSAPKPNLLKKGGFESWDKGVPSGWSVLNNTNGSIAKGTKSNNVHKGSNSMQVKIKSSGKAWKTQILSPKFNTKKGNTYKVTVWIKASTSGCKYQLEGRSGGNVSYSGTQTTPTSYTMETFSFKAKSSSSSIAFDMGASPASITWIDDITVKVVPKNTGGGGVTHAKDSTAVANFMKKYITQTVSHFKGKVKGWDVVNEPLTSDGGFRTVSGTPKGNIFYWNQYIGPGYIPMAFKYAHQADPNAKLFINEYNLESNPSKLSALINLVNKMKMNGVPIDGIGTEMHISINTSLSGIDNAFKKLASTGLLVRISELDVRINPTNIPTFKPIPRLLTNQGLMYNYVVWSYMKYVPKDQRAGIGVWNLLDSNSWIVVDQKHDDYPTLLDKNYHKKPAFSGMMRGLQGKAPPKVNKENKGE